MLPKKINTVYKASKCEALKNITQFWFILDAFSYYYVIP